MTMRRLRAALCALLTVALVDLGASAGVARAELISTLTVLTTSDDGAADARARVETWLARAEVAQQLEAMGVDPAEARSRVAMLTPAQVIELDGRIAELPAGGDVLGVLAVILVGLLLFFLITDLAGWTDVYPFINPVGTGRR